MLLHPEPDGKHFPERTPEGSEFLQVPKNPSPNCEVVKQEDQAPSLLRLLVDQSNDAIEVVDPTTLRFLDVNQKACTDLGYTREELLSLQVRDIDPTTDADLLAKAAADGRVSIAPLSADDVAKSQRSGLRHRREGLSSRLAATQRRGDWHPPKRVAAGSFAINSNRRRLYTLREQLRDLSHSAFLEARAKTDLSPFVRKMRPMVERYQRTLRGPLVVRVSNRIKRLLSRWRERLG